MCCSGALYWSGGTGSPGYIYTLGRVSGVLKKFSLAGNTLTLAGVAANAGNFSTYGGALLSLTAYCAQHIKVPDRTQLRHRLASKAACHTEQWTDAGSWPVLHVSTTIGECMLASCQHLLYAIDKAVPV